MSARTEVQPNADRRRQLERELQRCLTLLTRSSPPERIILFGSLAAEDVSEWSDLDMVIIRDTDLPFLERSKAVLALLRPQVAMDVLVYTPEEFRQLCEERPFVRDEIPTKGKVIYERSA